MSTEKGTFLGLGTIILAIMILVLGYWLIWERRQFWERPLSNAPPALQEPSALFDAYLQDKTKLDEEFAGRLKRNTTERVNISLSKNRDELLTAVAMRSMGVLPMNEIKKQPLEEIRALAIGMMTAEFESVTKLHKAEQAALAAKYRDIYREKAAAEESNWRNQQGWAPSIVSSVLVVLLAGGIGYLGLRLLRRAGMPGTVFEPGPK